MAAVVPVTSLAVVPDASEPRPIKGNEWWCTIVDAGNAHSGKLPQVRAFGKDYEVCWRSLFIFPVSGTFRRGVLSLILWKWFDRFILFLIMVNSILLAAYQYRADDADTWNWIIDKILDRILTFFFTVEFLLKVIAWGFFLDKRSYLREVWNWLDFIVVVTALISLIPGMDSGLGFLRLFRVLRPLRSLKQVPQMKALVNTVITSIPRLANVTVMMFFFFWIFGIVGITLMDGIFYHGCRSTPAPVLRHAGSNATCWEWAYTGDDRLCGGRYTCQDPPEDVSVGFCGGREDDPNKAVRPVFEGGKQGFPWCQGSEPKKIFAETDFIHFDHIGGALLTVFQCMTMEGWTDVMYYVQDGYDFWIGTIYFFTLIPITSFFLLNVALAVVDEARDDFDVGEEEEEEEPTEKVGEGQPAEGGDDGEPKRPSREDELADLIGGSHEEDEEELWFDCTVVRVLHTIATNEVFTSFVMFFIAGNVVTMMLEQFPPEVSWQDFLEVCEKLFLGIFCVEMAIMLGAMGPKGYVRNPVTCFDGIVVIISLVQAIMGGGGSAFTALRTLRLFRVINKLANSWPSFRVLLKAIVQTGISLNYWLVLFVLFLYIWTLMWMSFFNRQFHFEDMDSLKTTGPNKGQPWCAGTEGEDDVSYRQDCIPRAHFDTFLWALVTIFQIMTGENWNWIMYAGMRAQHWIYAGFFIALIVFGQILFLSLFLSMLMSKFDTVQDKLEKFEKERLELLERQGRKTLFGQIRAVTTTFGAHSRDMRSFLLHHHPEDEKAVGPEREEERDARVVVRPRSSQSSQAAEPEDSAGLPGQPDPRDDDTEGSPKKGDASSPLEAAGPKPWEGDERDAEEEGAHTPKGMPVMLVAPPVPNGEKTKDIKVVENAKWPRGYAWFVLSESNPLRRGCRWILAKKVRFLGTEINAFDNFILFCILVSTVCMGLDYPLRNPADLLTKIIRQADTVFAVIFIVEMALKLIAMGLFWGPDAYLKSGWNWLDGIVVCVSVLSMVSSGSGGFLKTLRILRAFRPLRVISRNQDLKIVVQTIFASLPALATLVIVCVVFLLIFALFAVTYLNGTFYSCTPGPNPVLFQKDLGDAIPSIPLCLSPTLSSGSIHSVCPHGVFQTLAGNPTWVQDTQACPWPAPGAAGCEHRHADMTLAWRRATADTPICVGRCGLHDRGEAPAWLCPRRYETTAELPSNCADPPAGAPGLRASQRVGEDYLAAMTRVLAMPCGGSAVNASAGRMESPATAVSCREAFCPSGVSADKAASCAANCRKHPHFCVEACTGGAAASVECASCRRECEAACECEEYCEPLIKDAALCYEQGGKWQASLPQNFDNIANALLTLFEISSTEGWVDVMYAACDARQPYEEPRRDHQQWLFAPFFMFYMFMSFMFLLNLSVGVIVDTFMDLKHAGHQVMLTSTQKQWIDHNRTLYKRAAIFNVRNLHLMPRLRRRVYDIVSSRLFETCMTGVIVLNTMVMASKIYPSPADWLDDVQQGLDYGFLLIYTVEFIMKLYALRRSYWHDVWCCFDFSCVLAAYAGLVVDAAAPDFEVGRSLARLFRIFRIVRLFRLLRSARLNKIFMALVLSLPKLGNVLMILVLLLILYSILGVSLFSTVKHSEWLNTHGNFMNFGWAFITLFRAVTGEAWNSIMHDLLKSEEDFFSEGSWCTPDHLFDTSTEASFNLLKDKCLIDRPNSCVQTVWGWNFLPAAYWVTYILVICLMVMNLVIAVILEGYNEGKASPETRVIDLCVKIWKKYDTDHRMVLPIPEALAFINEVISTYANQPQDRGFLFGASRPCRNSTLGINLERLPMKIANNLQMTVTKDGHVHWLHASKQVLLFTCTQDNPDVAREIETCEANMDKRDLESLRKAERKKMKMLEAPSGEELEDIRLTVAATKVQRAFRRVVHLKRTARKA